MTWESASLLVFSLVLGTLLLSLLLLFLLRRSSPFHLRDRVVLITGAGSGIGRELALQLANRGAVLVLLDLREELLKKVAKEIEKERGERKGVHIFVCDVSNASSVREVGEEVKKAILPAKVSVIVNNAGIVNGKSFLSLSEEELVRINAVNYLGHCWVLRCFLPDMIKANDGMIVTISSMMGLLTSAKLVDYCGAKWANVGMHRALRLELALEAPGVQTLLVCPYIISTGMFEGAMEKEFSSLVFPPLSPSTLVSRIVSAMERRKTELIGGGAGLRGLLLSLAPTLVSLLPSKLYDLVCGLNGGARGMDTFKGRGREWNLKTVE